MVQRQNWAKFARSKILLPANKLHQHNQVRNFPWVPIAYRKGSPTSTSTGTRTTRPRSPVKGTPGRGIPRTRTPPSRRSRRASNVNAGLASSPRSGSSTGRHGSLTFALQSAKGDLMVKQDEVDLAILQYQRSLVLDAVEGKHGSQAQKSTKSSGTPNKITTLLSKLQDIHKQIGRAHV